MKIKLTNDYHGTEINLITKNMRLTKSQMIRARRTLCGVKGCCCGDGFGARGPQTVILVPIRDPQTAARTDAVDRVY